MLFIIILSILFFVITITSFTNLIPFILAICNFILASLNLITDRNNFISRLIQLISLFYIILFIFFTLIQLTTDLYVLSFTWIISFRDYKYRKQSYVQNERTKFFSLDGLNDIKTNFLNKLADNQTYLIKIKYQFPLKTSQYYNQSMCNPLVITNQCNPQELIAQIISEITFLVEFNRLEKSLIKNWEDDLIIEIRYFTLHKGV